MGLANLIKPVLDHDHIPCLDKDLNNFHSDPVLYDSIEELVSILVPSFQDEFDTVWDLYVPMRRESRIISVPMSVSKYQDRYFLFMKNLLAIRIDSKQGHTKKEYHSIVSESNRFMQLLKKEGFDILKKTVPYDHRTGTIKGVHVLEQLMSKKEKTILLEAYNSRNKDKINSISLNDYLETAAICYKAAFGKKTKGLSPLEMYERWADGNNGGMLDLKPNSKLSFTRWKNSIHKKAFGSHPFRIIYGYNRGIFLRPPDNFSSQYLLSIGSIGSYETFLNMIVALSKQKIPFNVLTYEEDNKTQIDDIIEFHTGQSILGVNKPSENYGHYPLRYIPCRYDYDHYFHKIKWDPLVLPKFKQDL